MTTERRKLFWDINEATQDKLTQALSTTVIKSEIYKLNFDLEETEWYLRINKNEKDGKVCLSIFLYNNLKSNVDTTFEFGIVNKTIDYRLPKAVKSGADWLTSKAFGFTDFISLSALFVPNNGYVKDGKITFFCELAIRKAEEIEMPTMKKRNVLDVSGCFFKHNFKDFELKTSDKNFFKCHKVILAERSPVFEGMFASADTEEARTNFVDIKDVDSKTMAQFLRFVYGLEVENLSEIAHDLLIVADKYLVDDLKKICIESLIINLSKENVLESLVIADKIIKAEKLFDACMILISRNHKYLNETPEWKALPQPLLLKIIKWTLSRSEAANHVNLSTYL